MVFLSGVALIAGCLVVVWVWTHPHGVNHHKYKKHGEEEA
jgi:hypothetical protein